MDKIFCRLKARIQPFERRLALRELFALAAGPAIPVDGDLNTASTFSVSPAADAGLLRRSLAYWHSVGSGGASALTAQIRGEATHGTGRGAGANEALLNFSAARTLRPAARRCLRYGTHGLHEYRGKFFPQLVCALMNIAQLPRGALVLDPMCGSGTTLVEAILSQRRGLGLDMNPLSVFVTQAKCDALTLDPAALTEASATLRDELRKPAPKGGEWRRSARLADRDRLYLERWFAPDALSDLDRIEYEVCRLRPPSLRNFYLVCLSNILRSVSWQKNGDLRVRREKTELASGEAVARFLREAERSARTVAAFLAERGLLRPGSHRVIEDDARRASDALSDCVGNVDAIITSPPYATALPYIDTDRLSLVYLGLLPRPDHRMRDTLMIGNREIGSLERAELWTSYLTDRCRLPASARSTIERIHGLNAGADAKAGFRRRNLPALLSKYFFDMREVMHRMSKLLKPGGQMFVVVGNNRTTAGGQKVDIPTSEILRDIAEDSGFQTVDAEAMDMLPSRAIFRKNAVPSETILRFEAVQ